MRIAILSAGASRHARNLQTMLQRFSDSEGWGWETEFLEWRKNGYDDYDFARYDWCWWEGCFERVFELVSRIQGPKHIARWVGTDILQHQDMVSRGYPDPLHAATIHLADAPNLVEEARALVGVDVGYVRSIPPETYGHTPTDRWDNILAYVPDGREDFFRWSWFTELATDYPDITFNIIGREANDSKLGNVHCIKEISGNEKRQLFERCFAYLRPIQHDGVGLTLIEMAQMGRWVSHSDTRIPYALPARSVGEMEFHLDRILETRQAPPKEVSDHYRREYDEGRLREDLEGLRRRMG